MDCQYTPIRFWTCSHSCSPFPRAQWLIKKRTAYDDMEIEDNDNNDEEHWTHKMLTLFKHYPSDSADNSLITITPSVPSDNLNSSHLSNSLLFPTNTYQYYDKYLLGPTSTQSSWWCVFEVSILNNEGPQMTILLKFAIFLPISRYWITVFLVNNKHSSIIPRNITFDMANYGEDHLISNHWYKLFWIKISDKVFLSYHTTN